MTGPTATSSSTLRGIMVVEVPSLTTAPAGRLLADAGAHVLLVESHELATSSGRRSFRQLIEDADILLEAEEPGRLAELGIDYVDLTRRLPKSGQPDPTPGPPAVNDQLIHVSITPFGRTSRGPMSDASRQQPMTDHTISARAGWTQPVDDRETATTPTEVAARMAFVAALTALLARPQHGGQFVDVSILAAANTCAGASTTGWLAARETPES